MGEEVNPPYVPGPDGARYARPPGCAACGATTREAGIRTPLTGFPGEWVCADFTACVIRYRGGVSAGTYAAGLRGEILAVTP